MSRDNLLAIAMPSVGCLYKLEADHVEPPVSHVEHLLWIYVKTLELTNLVANIEVPYGAQYLQLENMRRIVER